MHLGKLVLSVQEVQLNGKKEHKGKARYYFKARLSQSTFKSSFATSYSNGLPDSCIFDISCNSYLFWTVFIDLYECGRIFSDQHLGRAEIRMSETISISEEDTRSVSVPLYTKENSPTTHSVYHRHTQRRPAVGQIKVAVSFHRSEQLMRIGKIGGTSSSETSGFSLSPSEAELDLPDAGLSSEHMFSNEAALARAESEFESELNLHSKRVTGPIGLLFSPEVAQLIKSIQSLVYLFGQGIKVSRGRLMFGYFLLERFHKYHVSHPHTGSMLLSSARTEKGEEIALAKHLWKHCLCAFGWHALWLCNKTENNLWTEIRKKDSIGAICKYLEVRREDILRMEMTTREHFRPSYLLIRNEGRGELLLCIRGTIDANDTNIDLACEYVPWKTGFVHQGIYVAARWFLVNLYDEIVVELQKQPFLRFRATGHSLGGATASMFTMLLQERLARRGEDERRLFDGMKCYAFGAAPIVSKSLLEMPFNRHIISIVNEYDIISCLCYGTVMDFRQMLLCASQIWDSKELFAGTPDEMDPGSKVSVMHKCRRLIQADIEKNLKLYIPGTLWHMYEEKGRQCVELSNALLFNELVLRKNAFAAHLPSKYDEAITRL